MYLTDLAITQEDKLYFLEMNKLTQNYLEIKQNSGFVHSQPENCLQYQLRVCLVIFLDWFGFF